MLLSGNMALNTSAISWAELYEKWDITDFNVHKISALLCSFLKANSLLLLVSCSVLLLGNEVDGFSLCSGLDFSGLAPFLLKNSLTESTPCNYFSKKFYFFPEPWLFTAFSPMLKSANVFIHNLHLAFVLSEGSGNNQSLHSLFTQSVLNLAILEAILLISYC